MYKFEEKVLATTTNARAELNDIFDPIIQETLNDTTTLYGLLRKEKNIGGDYVRWRVRNARNASAASYAETDTITTGNAGRKKVSTPVKLVKVGWDVTGLMIEANKNGAGIGDILGEEIKDATADLLVELNSQINSDGTGAATDLNGLVNTIDNGVTAAAAYISIYGVADRTAAGFEFLVSPTVDKGAVAVALADLRAMIRSSVTAGAKKSDLLFVTTHAMKDAILDLIQDIQRLIPTSAKVGFEGLPTFDGVPIHADHQAASKTIFLLDMATCMMKVTLDFTTKALPLSTDGQSGFIKGYMEFICKSPNKSVKYHNFA